ncbi:MAG: serine/threonine protein kinase [Burkholderiales bacterium PBB5]|nr:MAG: serine/threonine protein kinase [Burkholderiales bacterium PBB5]
MSIPMPERLGKYRLTEVLGEGAMGIVYKGFDPDIQREVAIKTLRGAGDEPAGHGVSHADRFRNEAQAAGRLQHPGIVAVYDYGRHGDLAFIAMEYVRGHTLSRYLQQAAAGVLSIGDDDLLSIVGQLLEALHHAHEQGVWHRDVKPSNLIMTRSGKIKVSDFGIARIESAGLTQVVSLIGTPMYMAPEQFQGRPIDRRVDLYAAGVVLYQLLAGEPPFSGAPDVLMYKAVHEPVVLPSRKPGKQHLAAYDPVLARALAKDPAQRFADAMQFRDALAAVVGRMHNAAVSDATVTALMPLARTPLSERGTTSGPPPTHFNDAQLAQAEASLARHVGPLARVLVRRAARECYDLPALYARLADQVTDPGARSAFVQQAAVLTGSLAGSGVRSAASASATRPPTAAPMAAPTAFPSTQRVAHGQATGTADAPVSPALLEAAQRARAQQLGPIARVVVKKAAEAAPQRQAFIQKLAAAVDDPVARARLIEALSRIDG